MRIITVISYNLWDKNPSKKDLLDWITINIINKKPDIILFQEVTNAIIIDLTTTLRQTNYQFKISNQSRENYEIICAKWPIVNFKFKKFSTTETKRGILWSCIKIEGKTFIIANSQLEQGPNFYHKRIGQLDCLFDFLSKSNNIVILGCDTGLYPDENYSNDLLYDAWIETGKNKYAKYTYDSTRNSNISQSQPIQSRPDRIFFKGNLDDMSFQLIGTNFISDKYKLHPNF